MKIIFYGNVLKDNIKDIDAAKIERQRIINEFLPIGMDIFNTTRKLIMPRAIIRNYPDTLDKESELYHKIVQFKAFFGSCLTEINYIPLSGDLELIINNEQFFLSNILLAVSVDMGKITIE